jgi:protein involved in polysaccharide export with SLBB domain
VHAPVADESFEIRNTPRGLPGPYRLHVGDRLHVRFYRNPELDQEVVIRPDGMISLPYVNEVKAAGLTPSELDSELAGMYRGELANPDVTVIVVTFAGQRIYMGGEVVRQGVLDLTANLTLMQAVAASGGFTTIARRDAVVLVRQTPEDGTRIALRVDVRPILDGSDPNRDVPLEPYDMVLVPTSSIGDLNEWVNLYIRGMLPIDASSVGTAAAASSF